MWAQVDGEHVAGAASRRRERRHGAYLKYARMSVAMALSEYQRSEDGQGRGVGTSSTTRPRSRASHSSGGRH